MPSEGLTTKLYKETATRNKYVIKRCLHHNVQFLDRCLNQEETCQISLLIGKFFKSKVLKPSKVSSNQSLSTSMITGTLHQKLLASDRDLISE